MRTGESLELETYDARPGYSKSPDDKEIPGKRPGFDRTPPSANPSGGPVYLDGAERGDVLAVAIEDILVDDYSWVALGPRRGPPGESPRRPEPPPEYPTEPLPPAAGPSGPRPRAPLPRTAPRPQRGAVPAPPGSVGLGRR